MPKTRMIATVFAALLASFLSMSCVALGQTSSDSGDEEKQRVIAEKFLDVLLQRPTAGTALDRVMGYYVARGEVAPLLERLSKSATESQDADLSGRHWMLVGLVQMERGEDAAAEKAFAQAEAKLKDNALAAFYHGQVLLLLGDNDRAATAMQLALDRKPQRADYLNIARQLGRIYQRAGRLEDALKIWNDLEKNFPNDEGVRQRIAATLAEEGDLKAALKRYDALAGNAKVQNDQISFALLAAELRFQLGEKEQATKDLEALLAKLRPGSYLFEEARRRIETSFLSSGDYAGLASYYERWNEQHPEDVDAMLRLARTLSVQGRSSDAYPWFERAIAKAPSDSLPRLAIIDAYLTNGRFQDAAAQYEPLVKLAPNNPDYLVRWGQALLNDSSQPEVERTQAAAAIWKRLASARPKDATIQSQVADLLRSAKLIDDAIAGYKTAIGLAPEEPQHKEYLGEYLYQLGRKPEALIVWRSLAEGSLRTRENLVRLAEVLHQFEEPDEALTTLTEACGMRPKIHERLRLADWLRDASQFDKALEQLSLARSEAESVDDRDLVFSAAVKTYQASGQLEEQIVETRKTADSSKSDGEPWRRLAVLYEANRQPSDALQAIEMASKLAPSSIETLEVASRMYEEAGQIPVAIEKRRQLANSDQRFRNGHLQRLASLYLRVGNSNDALAAGKEMLSGAGGSVEAFKFYAELCGQIGRDEERLDTLRRCVRLNPRSVEAQEQLAAQLASDFKTEQAIELYWKMLDGTSEIEPRREIVVKLADLYLRNNRLSQLVNRLELRGRELNDRRTAIDLTATAYQHAGDLGLAREALEGLLRESGKDTMLMERLMAVAEQAGEVDRAVELQRELARLAPGQRADAKLASLLIDIGSTEEAQALWLGIAEKDTDREQMARNVDRLFAAKETQAALKMASRLLEMNPSDWEMKLRLMVIQAAEGNWEQSAKIATELSAMNVSDSTIPAASKALPGKKATSNTPASNMAASNSAASRAARLRAGIGSQAYKPPPIRIQRMQAMYPLYQLVDERYGGQGQVALPKPIDFGHAKLMANYVQWKQLSLSSEDVAAKLEQLKTSAMAPDASIQTMWHWYDSAQLATMVLQTSRDDVTDPSTWGAIWRLAEADPEDGILLIAQRLANRVSYARQSANTRIKLKPIEAERLNWMKEKAENKTGDQSPTGYLGAMDWGTFYTNELRIAGKEKEAEDFFKQKSRAFTGSGNASQMFAHLQYGAQHCTDDEMWEIVQKVASEKQTLAANMFGSSMPAAILSMFCSKERIDKKLSLGPTDATYRQRVFELFDRALVAEAEGLVRRKTLRLTGIGGARNSYINSSGNYRQITIAFPPQGLGPEDEFIRALYGAWEINKDQSSQWIAELNANAAKDGDARHRVLQSLAAAILCQWTDKPKDAIDSMASAIKRATSDAPHLEPELRLMQADLLLRQDRKGEALQAIDGLSVYDQNLMAVREFAAAKLAAAMGDKERAKEASKRLMGVRLDTEAQVELAKLMKSLGMHELAADLVRRMRSRGGSTTAQLQTLINYFVTSDQKDQAAEVAVELLRRSPAEAKSSNYITQNQQLRKIALQTLASTGKLKSLIEAAEKRLERSPKSQRIRAELAEMYLSAGQSSKAQSLLSQAGAADIGSTAALELSVKQLVASGNMDQACDAYSKLLRRKPQIFTNDFYEVKRPFEQTKRLGELVDVVIEVGLKKFESYRVAELCSDMLQENKDAEKAKKLFLLVLENPSQNGRDSYALNSILSSGTQLLKDQILAEKTLKYMISTRTPSNEPWSTLFAGYSTSSDGRHNNATTSYLRAIADNAANCEMTEKAVREALAMHEDWYEGKAWLGMILTARRQYDEAKTLLAPLIASDFQPAPTHDALWLIGSLIDQHKPMQALAAEMYEYAMEKTTDPSNREFQYSLANRACKLMAEIGNKDRARSLALQSLTKQKDQPISRGDEAYEAYRTIRETMSMMDFLLQIDYPADALRLARQFDRSKFAKAGRFLRGHDVQFEQKYQQLLVAVRKQGGLSTIEAMIDGAAKGEHAIDFGVTVGMRPFSANGLQSLWIELLNENLVKPEQKQAISGLYDVIKSLAVSRPKDDTVALANAILTDASGDSQPLKSLVDAWIQEAKATGQETEQGKKIGQGNLRRQLLILALVQFDRRSSAIEPQWREIARSWDANDQMLLLAELGRNALARLDTTAAAKQWTEALEIKELAQWYLLDLAHAAVNADLNELSITAAAAAGKAPDKAVANVESTNDTSSLGNLLGANRARSFNSPANRNEQVETAETRLARRIIELDDAWSSKKIAAADILPALQVFLSTAGKMRPLETPFQIQDSNTIVVNSVLDRAARRAHECQRIDELLPLLTTADAVTHLMAAQVLLRGQRGDQAVERLSAIDPANLIAIPRDFALQVLLLAIEEPTCRPAAFKLGLKLLEQNKPAERYSNIAPYDSLAIQLAKCTIQHSMGQDNQLAAINHYLELSRHDNDRYGGSYGTQRLITQLEEIAKLFLSHGDHTAQALKYLAMRQVVFNMGLDSGEDWVGNWALSNVQSNLDRKAAYKMLADWTFDGDGSLAQIVAFARRQPLPAWIPESVSGAYPIFPPVADPMLPLGSNFYSLTKLAEEAGAIEDLKSRFEQAISKERAGATQGQAIMLAALKQPVSTELLNLIDKRLASIAPGSDNAPKAAVPLAELQLVNLLAQDPIHADWARKTAENLNIHGNRAGRAYLAPWLARFQWRSGWTDSSKLSSASELTHWAPSIITSAKEYYEGKTPSVWLTNGSDLIEHVCGFGTDALWLRYPIEGNFEFEAELSDGRWSESEVAFGGLRFASNGSNNYVEVTSDESRDFVRFNTQSLKKNQWNKHAIKLDEKTLSYSINDVLIYREPRSVGAPWLSLRSTGTKHTSVRNVKLSGTPTISNSVELLQGEHLRGWSGIYYGQALPTSRLDATLHEKDAKEPSNPRLAAKPGELNNLAWSMADGELVNGKARSGAPGEQSVIQYLRPLLSGESLSYEFYYEKGKSEIHPSLSRTAFVLRPEGLRLHWMTEGNTSWKTPADYEAPLPGADPQPLPLKNGDWNSIKLQVEGEQIKIALNGETILDQAIEGVPRGAIFGLFHYAKSNSVRVRSVRLEGNWPREFPSQLLTTSGDKQ